MAKKTKRVKTTKPDPLPIDDWQHADDFLRQIGDIDLEIANAQAQAKEVIDATNKELADTIKPMQGKIKHLTESLQAFAVNYKDEFKKVRSRTLNFGVLGWRRSTSIRIKKDQTLELIKKLFSRARAKALITVKESPDKNALAKLKDEDLAGIEARRVVKDEFFVEPSIPEAVDYGGGA